ncbi:MAG TPA: FKBP-type peptidyl-prolyl cis-trans isomerase [Bacteroidia bacterium]|nr:FKBP-type peptidyl-prolyl cis-trans isomerase [Bacteroidia bacterium]
MKYSTLMVACLAAVFSFSSCDGQKKGKDDSMKLVTALDSASYGIGTSIGRNMKKDGLDSVNVDLVAKGLRDILENKTEMLNAEQCQTAIQTYFQGIQDKKSSANVEAGKKFLEENAKKPGVVTLPSGLQYQIITEGTGPKPGLEDKVTTNYHGTLINGKVFDSSVERGQPVSFAVNGVIPGWTEALQLMPVGSKWKLFIPSNLAYGERGAGGDIGPNETLIFEVELISIDK